MGFGVVCQRREQIVYFRCYTERETETAPSRRGVWALAKDTAKRGQVLS